MYIFSYSYLGGNQIEELPSRIFTYNTELTVLWVKHLYVHIYRKVDKLPPPLQTIEYQRATQTDEAVAEIHGLNL